MAIEYRLIFVRHIHKSLDNVSIKSQWYIQLTRARNAESPAVESNASNESISKLKYELLGGVLVSQDRRVLLYIELDDPLRHSDILVAIAIVVNCRDPIKLKWK